MNLKSAATSIQRSRYTADKDGDDSPNSQRSNPAGAIDKAFYLQNFDSKKRPPAVAALVKSKESKTNTLVSVKDQSLESKEESKAARIEATDSQASLERPKPITVETKALKIVKHLPKSEDQLLDREFSKISSMKRQPKNVEAEAQKRVKKFQDKVHDRVEKANNEASEYSDVETVNHKK